MASWIGLLEFVRKPVHGHGQGLQAAGAVRVDDDVGNQPLSAAAVVATPQAGRDTFHTRVITGGAGGGGLSGCHDYLSL